MAQNVNDRLISSPQNFAEEALLIQQTAHLSAPFPSLETRKKNLKTLHQLLFNNKDAICEAISKDYGNRAFEETLLVELFTSLDGITSTLRHLKSWMKPEKRSVDILYAGSSNRVIAQPKGVVGIVVPWNYPLFLCIGPMTSALAAGNRCMIKMAANSKHLCDLLNTLFSEAFDESLIKFLPGVKGSIFSNLPFDHIIFTGSAEVGKTVMEAAAKNLTPVTLELGGKSPTIICDDFDIELALKRILYTKFINAGQTCVAPDTLYVPENKLAEVIKIAKDIMPKRYADPINSDQYTSIIDDKAYARLINTIDDAKAHNAEVISLIEGAETNSETRKIPPHFIINPDESAMITNEEIFGPLMLVKTYKNIDDVLAYINQRQYPLGLYLFTNSKKIQHDVIHATLSGGVCINDCLFHVAQHDLPFGGVGMSGMGSYHAIDGFREFSKMRPVFKQSKFASASLLYPPYGSKFKLLMSMMLKKPF